VCIADVDLTEHVGGVARDAQGVAKSALPGESQEAARLPIRDLVAQPQPHVKNGARDLRRRVHQRLHVVAFEINREGRVVQLG
jgi:hypothetical protein